MTAPPRRFLHALCASLALAASAAPVGAAPLDAASPACGAAPSLYDRLGGKPAIEALVGTLVIHLKNDPRTRVAFAENNPARMRERLGAQFCELAGGPCKTIEPDMRKVHSALGVTPTDFDNFIALIAQSMVEAGVAEPLQRCLIDRFTPMREQIVNAR